MVPQVETWHLPWVKSFDSPRWKGLKRSNIARVFATTGRDSQISNNIWKFKFFICFHSPAKKEKRVLMAVYRFNQGSFLCRVSNFSERRDEEIYHVYDHIFIEYKSSMICWCHFLSFFFFLNRISIWLKRIYNEIKKPSRRTRYMLDNNNNNKDIKNVIGNAGERIVSGCKRNVSMDSNRSRIMRDE